MHRLAYKIRTYGVWCVLIAELIAFGVWYCGGREGIGQLRRLRVENTLFEQELTFTQVSIANMQAEIERCQRDDFWREHIARTELQMAREGEEIYYLTCS